MAEQPSPAMWTTLRRARPSVDDMLETCVVPFEGADTAIMAGIDAQSDLHLLIPLYGPPRAAPPADLSGLRIRRRELAGQSYLGLVAAAPYERVFTPFCREVVAAVVGQRRDPWAAVTTIVREWQAAWKPGRQRMTDIAQVGLVGELIVMDRIVLPVLGPDATFRWSGPIKERHDFICGDLHLEVKATRGSRHEHRISRLDQLWTPAGRQLVLASLQLEQSIGGTVTLATLIDGIVEQLRPDMAASDDFMRKLDALNWSEEMRRSGELLAFNLRDDALYEVDEEFPRFAPDFRPPRGVVEVRYTVDLANLPTLDVDEVRDLIRTALPGDLGV